MTREEAIKYGKNILIVANEENDADAIDFTKMAITALKQEPCEDCISRQATVERLCKVAEFMNEKRNGLGSPYVMAALFIQDNKDEFPPVTPKPKTDVLDKIRAEIKEESRFCPFTEGLERALEIIDKYKAESEG